VKCAGKNLGAAALFFAAGAIWLVVALRNDFQALYLVTAGLSFFAGTIKLINDFKVRHTDEKSNKKGSE